MRATLIFSAVSALVAAGVKAQTTTAPITGTLGNATVVTNNPVGLVYTATLPTTEFFNPADPRGNVKGSITATSAPDGIGVQFQVSFSNFPTSGGPFLYHIHASPVNSTGSCASTLGHLDPFIRGETPSCDHDLPQTCQVGDLSGKYGKITTDPFTAEYVDPFASLVPGLGSFFGNRSITLHFANTTRLTCANWQPISGSTPSNATVTAPSGPRYTGAASGLSASLLSVFGVVGAALLL